MTATLAGTPASNVVVHFPVTGVWTAEVELVAPVTFAGLVSLVVGDLTLACTVVRGGPVEGSASYLVTGGAGGWSGLLPGKLVAAKSYRNDAGVKLSTVLKDAATAAGESVSLGTDRSLGVAFLRQAGPAWDVLARTSSSWWVDAAAVTQVRPRPSAAITAPFKVLEWKRARGARLLSADTLAPFQPGALLEGAPLLDVVLRARHASTRIEVRQ